MREEIVFHGRAEAAVSFDGARNVVYSPVTQLSSGNGRINADWLSCGLSTDSLMAVPSVNFFSPRHLGLFKLGWWNVSLAINGGKRSAYKSATWYDTNVGLSSEFTIEGSFGDLLRVGAAGLCPTGEPAFLHTLNFLGLAAENELHIVVKINGELCLGKEVGRLEDGAGNYVPKGPTGRPALELGEGGFDVSLPGSGLHARLATNIYPEVCSFKRLAGGVEFSLECPVTLKGKERQMFQLTAVVGDSREEALEAEKRLQLPTAAIRRKTLRAWQDKTKALRQAAMPVKILEAGFAQGIAYAFSNTYNFDGMTIMHADHWHYPLDLSRDSFYVSAALLYLDPEITRRHLAFYFQKAIPACGVGNSYVASLALKNGKGHFLLDAAIYPILELHRYWRFTGDKDFLRSPSVVKGLDVILETIAAHHSEETGLYRSEGRSSDERCVYPFFVPANMMLVTALEKLSEISSEGQGDQERAARFVAAAGKLRQAVERHAVGPTKGHGEIYAFEVDGKGRRLLYDHADMPNLLTAPWFGYCPNDSPIYLNTLRFLYSRHNQGYRDTADGRFASLCDGSKTMPDGSWPIGALGQIVANPEDRKTSARMLELVAAALGDNLQLPEIIDKHTGRTRSRRWFAWPSALYVVAYIEAICGIKVGRTVKVEPHPPEGWGDYSSPEVSVRGNRLKVQMKNGKPALWLNGKKTVEREFDFSKQ